MKCYNYCGTAFNRNVKSRCWFDLVHNYFIAINNTLSLLEAIEGLLGYKQSNKLQYRLS